MKKIKNFILIILIIALIVGIGYLIYNAVRSINYNKNAKNPILTLEVEGYGNIKIELKPEYAPNTVATIIKLAQNGYYDGKVFYGTDTKVVAGGMKLSTREEPVETEENVENSENAEMPEMNIIQTAEEDKLRVSDIDKSVKPFISMEESEYGMVTEEENGSEETDYKISINGEFVANGFNDNTLRFERGTIGLYRSNYTGENLSNESYNSGNSLFFITTSEDSSLNGQYTAFGVVLDDGMEIIDKMLTLPVEEEKTDEEGNSTSNNTAGKISENQEIKKYANGSFPVITKAKVETFGVDYGMPEYMKAFDYDKYMSDLILKYYQNK